MKQTIGELLYDTEKSISIDKNNTGMTGRRYDLYRTSKGTYFIVNGDDFELLDLNEFTKNAVFLKHRSYDEIILFNWYMRMKKAKYVIKKYPEFDYKKCKIIYKKKKDGVDHIFYVNKYGVYCYYKKFGEGFLSFMESYSFSELHLIGSKEGVFHHMCKLGAYDAAERIFPEYKIERG
jgi:hypothetical protein